MTGRARGRPAAGSTGDTREAILAAARAQFAAQGFTGTSLRSIAGEAGVDASLISHYFGDKAGLLVATMELPVNPVEKVRSVVEGELDGMGARLIRTFLETWDPHRAVFSTMVRSTIGSADPRTTPIFQLAQNVLVAAIRDRIDGPDAEARATLVASQVVGLAMLRYVIELDGLADAEVDEVVRQYAPSLQQLMDQ